MSVNTDTRPPNAGCCTYTYKRVTGGNRSEIIGSPRSAVRSPCFHFTGSREAVPFRVVGSVGCLARSGAWLVASMVGGWVASR